MKAVHSALSNCICIHENVQFLEIALKTKRLLKRYVKNLLLWDFLRICSLPSIPRGTGGHRDISSP